MVQSAVACGLESYSIKVIVTMQMRGDKFLVLGAEYAVGARVGLGQRWGGGTWLSRQSLLLDTYLLSSGADTSTKILGSLQI